MAHLEVEPKPSRPWWVWVLIILLLIALAALLFKKCNSDTYGTGADTSSVNSIDRLIVATSPDWSKVDFNSSKIADNDITDSDISISGNGSYTIYTLGENILFPSQGETISEAGSKKLTQISGVLKKRFVGATIAVFGSTDSTGPANENQKLGRMRAEAVKNWLSSNGGIAAENISVQSLGEKEPAATNQTTSGRQQNRNVSIVVFGSGNK